MSFKHSRIVLYDNGGTNSRCQFTLDNILVGLQEIIFYFGFYDGAGSTNTYLVAKPNVIDATRGYASSLAGTGGWGTSNAAAKTVFTIASLSDSSYGRTIVYQTKPNEWGVFGQAYLWEDGSYEGFHHFAQAPVYLDNPLTSLVIDAGKEVDSWHLKIVGVF